MKSFFIKTNHNLIWINCNYAKSPDEIINFYENYELSTDDIFIIIECHIKKFHYNEFSNNKLLNVLSSLNVNLISSRRYIMISNILYVITFRLKDGPIKMHSFRL